jgi:hypothetical protein
MKQEFLENPLIISNRLVFSCLNGDGAAYCLKSDSGFSNFNFLCSVLHIIVCSFNFVLSVHLPFTAFDYRFSILKLFL